MRNWFFLIAIFIIAIIQSTLLDYIKIFGVKPDFLLISVVIVSLNLELKWALVLSICAGFLKDALGINAFGINTLLFSLWSFLIMRLSKKISIDNNLIRAVLVFIAVIFNDIVKILTFLFLGNFFVPFSILIRTAFLESMYTALVSTLAFKIIKPTPLKIKTVNL